MGDGVSVGEINFIRLAIETEKEGVSLNQLALYKLAL